jgi:hypothetical protein
MVGQRLRWRRAILELDPVRDHEEIYRISAGYEFPWDYTRALELALFRTYCVPSISALLDATGEFRDRAQQRYDDTALLMAELAANGYDSPRGKEALRVINRAHGRYRISNDDMVYVLSTFIYEPIEWIDKYGWRPLTGNEKLAAYHFYREVGARMNIKDIPEGFQEYWDWKRAYEAETFVYSETNRRVGDATVGLLCGWFPKPFAPFVRLGVRALLDQPMLDAFGFKPAPKWLAAASSAGLMARGLGIRLLLPVRKVSKLGVQPRNRTYPGYPEGYAPSDLGAPPPSPELDKRWLRT